MSRTLCLALGALLAISYAAHAQATMQVCTDTTGGRVCGGWHRSRLGRYYASFRGIPYAKQPLGELRFKELQPLEPWTGDFDATEEGPVCPQSDVFYGALAQPRSSGEDCIRVNVHVPHIPEENNTSLPILVFIHGGGFAFGSGDSDLHGPDILMDKDVVVITFNYRLNVFGFLSLNSPQIPGNNGLRDMVTLLKWVRDNAQHFNGNPNDVTLAGQSAGAVSTHLLTLSPQAQGLFNKAIIMSGTAIPMFYTTTPAYAQFIADSFLRGVGITSKDPEEIHHQLTKMPLEKIMHVNDIIQTMNGLAGFYPVIENQLPGVEPVLAEDTEALLAKGYGSDILLLIGFTDTECQSFRKRFTEIDIMDRIKGNSLLVLSPTLIFSVPPETAVERAEIIQARYFNDTPTIEKFLNLCTDMYFQYPALKTAEYRLKTGGAPTYVYQFSYNNQNSAFKQALGLMYTGAAHVEDMTYVFQLRMDKPVHSAMNDKMKETMSTYFTSFMKNGKPTLDDSWQPVSRRGVTYRDINLAEPRYNSQPTYYQQNMMAFFDAIMTRR